MYKAILQAAHSQTRIKEEDPFNSILSCWARQRRACRYIAPRAISPIMTKRRYRECFEEKRVISSRIYPKQ